jgi:hypothetical protein
MSKPLPFGWAKIRGIKKVVAWALVNPEGKVVGFFRERNNATLNSCPESLGWRVVKLVEEQK